MKLSDYGTAHMTLALRGLEAKTLDPYLSGWHKRVVPTLDHLPVRMINNGAVDRAVHGVHVLRKIAGHGSLITTQRYLHPDATSIAAAGESLTAFLSTRRSPNGPQLRAVPNPERSIRNERKAR
jgi:hypothetical protein